MGYFDIEWKLSSVKEEDLQAKYQPLEEGEQHLYITDAYYDADMNKYSIDVESVENQGTSARIVYFVKTKDGKDNKLALGTLGSLGVALAGHWVGVPLPDCVIHGIVKADVKFSSALKEDGTSAKYPRIYKFEACDRVTYEAVKDAGLEVIAEQECTEE